MAPLRHCSSEHHGNKKRNTPMSLTALVLMLTLFHPSTASTFVRVQKGKSAPNVLPISPPASVADDEQQETPLQQVADSFESVLEAASQDDNIPMDPLLDACHTLLEVMQKTGPKAVARDFDNNLKKIKAAQEAANTRTISSLLQLEQSRGVHGQKGTLQEKSGAMGLLWIRRTLAFQSDFYECLLQGRTTLDASNCAYQQQLKPYHGWALTKCYNLFCKKMPPRRMLLERVGGAARPGEYYNEQQTLQELKRLVATWRPLLHQWKRTFVEMGMEDTRKV